MAAPEMLAAAVATIPSYCTHRQPTIMGRPLRKSVRYPTQAKDSGVPFSLGTQQARDGLDPPAIAALHQGNYATIPNYLERKLRYMDAGE
ncbi:MAG: hypothetical protein Q8M18_11390 [Bradyrhizobium sp.]|nr:hypothetical protein [Bradyrhizobium sp.]